MAIFNCKMCGGTLDIQAGETVAECEYCGAKQTLPKLDDEKRANLYERANHFRRGNEFDKAIAIYEQILNEDGTDAEAYWSLVLCRYGIEYVEDPLSHRRVPTVHRAQFTSIFDDDNYKLALQNADSYQRILYEEEAKAINEIQKGILAISQMEEPFDVFICYKETDADGRRTHDSVLANDLYYQLTEEGFKVFFARITLEDKLGSAYEPYIFAALNSAKVMVVLGTKPEFFNAVWVRNEWSRFLSLIKHGEKKMLIPAYKDMDPYDLPPEFSHLQAQDMSKLGFMQDLIRGIKKILGADKKPQVATVTERVVVNSEGHDIAPSIRRAFLFLEDGEFDSADEYAEKVLDINPECAEAYVAKLLVELRLKKPSDLANYKTPVSDFNNYQKALRFASPTYRETIEGYNNAIKKRIDTQVKDAAYQCGMDMMKAGRYDEAIGYFDKILNHKDAARKLEECKKLKETARLDGIYANATQLLNAGKFDEAAKTFESIKSYKDSEAKIKLCAERKETARKDAIYSQAMQRVSKKNATDVDMKKSIEELLKISGYKDVDHKVRELNTRLEKWYADKAAAEEAARVKAEEDRRTRERNAEIRRVKMEKTKKTAKKAAKIGIPSIAAVALVVILLVTWIIPLINFNKADSLINEGKYDEAMEIYAKLDGFSDSNSRIGVINSVAKIDNGQLEEGIKGVLEAGVPVKLTYGMGGGDFSGAQTVGAANNGGLNIVPLSAASASPASADTATEYTFNSAADFTGLKTPGRNGYRFVKWELDNYTYVTDGIFEIKVKAVWSTKDYTVDYNLAGGTVNGSNVVEYDPEDNAFTLTNPTRKGYTFTGWTGTGLTEPTLTVTVPTGSYGNRSYVANWKANEYVITLDANGGTVSNGTLNVVFDSAYTLPTPERTGYTFTGWTYGASAFADGKYTVDSSITLKANWTPITYTISYESIFDASNNNASTYIITDTVTLAEPVRTGYTFTGWTYEGQSTPTKSVTIEAGTVGNKTFTANWTANSYTLTLNANGGTVDKTTYTVVFGSAYTLPVPVKTGHDFLGWKDANSSNVYEEGTWSVASNLNLIAQYGASEYKIHLTLNGGALSDGSDAVDVVYNTAYVLPIPERAGYSFVGWYIGNEKQSESGTWIGLEDITVEAVWEANEYDVTLDANGGEVSDTEHTFVFDGEYVLPVPTRTGYDFVGWYDGDDICDSELWSIAKDVTLTAKWSPRNDIHYEVHHYVENIYGEFILTDTDKLLGTADAEITPDRKTYNDNVTPVGQTVTVSPDGTLVVEYRYERKTVNINLMLNSGDTIEPLVGKIGTTVTVPDGVRPGFTFGGWFTDAELTEKFDGLVPSTEITLYAKWNEDNSASDFTFTGTDSITITGYVGSSPVVCIPAYIGGKPVTVIASTAFVNNVNVIKVVVPNTVNTIEKGAFSGCSYLTDLTLPFVGGKKSDAVNSHLGYIFGASRYTDNASYVPTSLKSVTIDSGLIYPYSFNQCASVLNVTLRDGVTRICEGAFYGCSGLTTLNLGNGIYSSNVSAFEGCTGLVKVNVPTIEAWLGIKFDDNSANPLVKAKNLYVNNVLVSGELVIPDGVTRIEANSFYGYNKITSLVLPDSIELIGSFAFGSCTELTSVVINGNEVHIGSGAFMGCTSLEDVEINATILTMGSNAFDSCTSLKDVNITVDEITVGSNAFKDCAIENVKAPLSFFSHITKSSLVTVVITDGTDIPANFFYANATNLKSVTLPEGIETIGSMAFSGCSALESINIPSSVKSIGASAFNNCTSLKSVYIEDIEAWCNISFESSYANPLAYARKLYVDGELVTELVIPDSITAIKPYAFINCESIVSVYMNNVNSVGDDAFSGCTSIDSVHIKSVYDWCRIVFADFTSNPAGYGAYLYLDGEKLTEIVVPSNIMEIKSYSFAGCSGIEKVTLHNSVITIGSYAFSGCSDLADISFPESVLNIGEGAFKNCMSLVTVVLPDNLVSVSASCFEGCINLNSVTIPSYTVSIADKAFSGCYKLVEVINNSSLEIVAGSDTYGEVAKYAFTVSNESIKEVVDGYVFATNDGVNYLVGYMGNETELTLPDNYKGENYVIYYYAFYGNSDITNVVIPDSLTSISSSAFANCTGLESVTIGNGVTSIGNSAFRGCTGLTSIEIPNSVTSIGYSAFYGCTGLTSIEIPNSVTSIGLEAFRGCTGLTSVTIGSGVETIGSSAFSGCTSLESITIPFAGATKDGTENTHFGYIFGASSYSDNGSYVPASLKSVEITEKIGPNAFSGCTGLESVTIGSGVETIGKYAFYGCTGLTEIKYNAEWTTSIGTDNHIFSYAGKSADGINVIIGKNVTNIPSYLFWPDDSNDYYTPNIKTVTFEENSTCESIGSSAFANCTGLESVTIGNGVTSIGNSAFANCTGLESVTIGNGVTSIGNFAFRGCTGLTSIVIPNSVKSIGTGAFQGCNSLEEITLPYFSSMMFGYTTNQSRSGLYSTPSDLYSYEAYKMVGECPANAVFQYSRYTYDSSDRCYYLYSYFFYIPKSLKKVTITSDTNISDAEFRNCYFIENIVLPDNVTNIGRYAFSGCTGLTSIEIPNSVTSIDDSAFSGCTGLTSIVIPDSVTSIGYSAFSGCTGLTSIVIPDSVTSIGNYAFYGCAGLTSVTIGSGVETIGSYAFKGCTGLTSIVIPENVTSIGAYAFYNPGIGTNYTIETAKDLHWRYYTEAGYIYSLPIGNSDLFTSYMQYRWEQKR